MDMFTLMSGLQLTCIYGILAIGVSIIWSSLGMLNLAHGFTFAASGYGAWWDVPVAEISESDKVTIIREEYNEKIKGERDF